MKIFGHERKPGEGEQIGAVQRVHTMGIGRLAWEEVPHCKVLPSLVYKRKEGPLVKGLPVYVLKGYTNFGSRVYLSLVSV